MFKFDPNKLVVKYHKLKAVTTALGGSIHIIDPTSPPDNPELIKIRIPFAVARKFIKQTEFTKYLKPVTIAVLQYDDLIINIERDLVASIKDAQYFIEENRWVSHIESFLKLHLAKKLGTLDWCFDGRYVYHISPEVRHDLQVGGVRATDISCNCQFRTADVDCIDLYESNKPVWPQTGIISEKRGVIGFSCNDGFSITPPIWKNTLAIGSSATIEADPVTEQEDYTDATTGISIGDDRVAELIDRLDEKFALNLNFTLNAAKTISNTFGFDSIEPLQLPEIMLMLKTVNIPKLPRSIKSTFSIGLTPSHGLAWLMGLLNRAEELHAYINVRSTIKYLTSKGMFHKHTVNKNSLFTTVGHTVPPHFVINDVKSYLN